MTSLQPPHASHLPVQAGSKSPKRLWIIGGAIVTGAAIITLLLVLLHSSSLTGEWYGPVTVSGANIAPYEAYFDLQQSGNSVTGTGQFCRNSSSEAEPFSVSGTVNGSSVSLMTTTPFLGSGQGTYSGSNMTLAFTSGGIHAQISGTFKHGSLTAYKTACQALPA
jgi:hypothetical protein